METRIEMEIAIENRMNQLKEEIIKNINKMFENCYSWEEYQNAIDEMYCIFPQELFKTFKINSDNYVDEIVVEISSTLFPSMKLCFGREYTDEEIATAKEE